MQFVIIITILIGLAILVNAIRRRFFANRPAVPPEELDLLNNPISHAVPQEAHDPDEKTIPIYKLSNIAEANTLKALLEDNGIDCMVHSFYDLAYDGIWQAQKGWGVLKVLEKDQDKANDLIDAFLETKDQELEPLPDEMAQATPIPVGRPILANVIFMASLVILLAVGALIIVGLLSAYRDSGRELAEEGYNYSLNKEYDKAIECYNKAISHWYRESWVYFNRGYDKTEKGDYDGGIADYTKVIAKDSTAQYNRACCYALKKDKKMALSELATAISRDSNWKKYARKDDDFKWLWEDEEFKKLTDEEKK